MKIIYDEYGEKHSDFEVEKVVLDAHARNVDIHTSNGKVIAMARLLITRKTIPLPITINGGDMDELGNVDWKNIPSLEMEWLREMIELKFGTTE
jgi:hypothetical protein